MLAVFEWIAAVAIIVGVVILFIFARGLRRDERQARAMERRIDELSQIVGQISAGNTNLVRSTMSMERAVVDELGGQENEKAERAGQLLASQRKRDMKAMHHAVLSTADERQALRSSWALATEFGEDDTLGLMSDLERYRGRGSLAEFRMHREILAGRLSGKDKSR
jgi:uncharacterized membrane-anchored protein YhcB (DUF1043 family)